VVAPLTATAFTLGSQHTTWGEVFGFVTGALYVWLLAVEHIANWPVGIAASGSTACGGPARPAVPRRDTNARGARDGGDDRRGRAPRAGLDLRGEPV
jgi:hypothetical protein